MDVTVERYLRRKIGLIPRLPNSSIFVRNPVRAKR